MKICVDILNPLSEILIKQAIIDKIEVIILDNLIDNYTSKDISTFFSENSDILCFIFFENFIDENYIIPTNKKIITTFLELFKIPFIQMVKKSFMYKDTNHTFSPPLRNHYVRYIVFDSIYLKGNNSYKINSLFYPELIEGKSTISNTDDFLKALSKLINLEEKILTLDSLSYIEFLEQNKDISTKYDKIDIEPVLGELKTYLDFNTEIILEDIFGE